VQSILNGAKNLRRSTSIQAKAELKDAFVMIIKRILQLRAAI
jgi:hypothetical protein